MAECKNEADAIFISCANIHSIDVIDVLERVLKKPVITSNQAALWHALRTVGLNDVVPKLGKLLTLKGVSGVVPAE
jgi:arylmalonate decarboxylase